MKTILLVEDDQAQRELVRHVLEPYGYEVTEAATGEAGIRELTSSDFDGILLDLRMPKGSGEFVIQWILGNRPHLKPHILVITGDLLSQGLEAFLTNIQIPMLAKPYMLPDLIAAVGRITALASGNPEMAAHAGR